MRKIIAHLLKKGDTLAVLSRPKRKEGEEQKPWEERYQNERVLHLHETYAPELD